MTDILSELFPETAEEKDKSERYRAAINAGNIPGALAILRDGKPSPWLSERMIARLSPQRRANLQRLIREHLTDAQNGCDGRGRIVSASPTPHVARLSRMLGRLAALTA